jgi:ABC-type uncharacterized transport system auxiliary subunit
LNRPLGAAAVALAALLAPGCITVDTGAPVQSVPDRHHVVEVPAARPAASGPAGPAPASPASPAATVVAVRPFRGADRLGKRVLLREAGSRVVPLDSELWADEPAAAVTDAARETLASDGRFAAVVDASSAARVDVFLDGALLEFAIDAPGSGRAKAVVRLRLTWTAVRSGEVVASRLAEAAEEVAGPGTDGLGAAMGRAVAKAVASSVPASLPSAEK